MKKILNYLPLCIALLIISSASLSAQNNNANTNGNITNEQLLNEIRSIRRSLENNRHTYDQIIKRVDDIMWYKMLEDITYVDKVRLTGPPRWRPRSENDRFAANPLQFYC